MDDAKSIKKAEESADATDEDADDAVAVEEEESADAGFILEALEEAESAEAKADDDPAEVGVAPEAAAAEEARVVEVAPEDAAIEIEEAVVTPADSNSPMSSHAETAIEELEEAPPDDSSALFASQASIAPGGNSNQLCNQAEETTEALERAIEGVNSDAFGFAATCDDFVNMAIEHAGEAATFESAAMDHDRAGEAKQAIANYRTAAERLAKAASVCPEGLPDKAVLSCHSGEVLGRAVYLESLDGAPATAPLEQHIGSVQLTLGAEIFGAEPVEATDDPTDDEELDFCVVSLSSDSMVMADHAEARPSQNKRAASAATIAGGAGLLVLHAPVCAVAIAGAAAYATTRKDVAGSIAKKVGDVGLQTASRAHSIAEEYRIPEKLDKAVSSVVTERQREKVSSSLESLRRFDKKHQVSRTLGQSAVASADAAARGVASATSSLSSWVSKRIRK